MIVIAGLDRDGLDRTPPNAGRADILRPEPVVGDAQQIPFDLGADDARMAARGERLQSLAQKLARREMKRRAVVEIFVAQDPADARRPGQHAECRRVRHEGEIGRARHFGEPHAAAAGERGKYAGAGGIERRGGDADIVAAPQRRQKRRHGQRLGARIAVSVPPRQSDEMQALAFDPADDFGRKPRLLLTPQAVLFDECRWFSFGHDAQAAAAFTGERPATVCAAL